jgi:hypothetical protein
MKTVASLLALVASATAHGVIVSPPHRTPGTAYEAACGSTIYNNQASDQAGPVQLLMQSSSSITDAATCDLWLCKGYQFDDNTANVQSYTLGETVPWTVDIRAPHTGYANVSIVDTKTNSIIGSALKSWDVYASTSTGVRADETTFDITIPSDLEGCTTAGDCVIQWFWYSPPGVDQTYEGCVDFVISGSTAAPGTTTSTAAAEPTTTAAGEPVETTTSTALPVEPTTTVVAVPTTTVVAEPVEPTTTAVEVPTTTSIAAPVEPTTTTVATTTSAVTTTAVPTTLITRTRSATSTRVAPIPTTIRTTTSTAAPAATTTAKTPQSINACLDAVNACIREAQSTSGGAVDFTSCEEQRAACY